MATPIISNAETLTAFVPVDAHAEEVDEYLRTHPEANRLRENDDFEESRPYLRYPEGIRARSLTAGTLLGPNKLVVPPFVFAHREGKSLVSLMYLGSDICGHPGIIHGGLLATMLDENLARCCFPALPNKVGVTANLNIDYRAPAMANTYVVLRAETVKVEGRKAWVEGRIETLPEEGKEPVVLVEAKALFIEPKQAAVSFLSQSTTCLTLSFFALWRKNVANWIPIGVVRLVPWRQ
jgi:acyl-coenzyme A thioesterase PaaI-like protein